MGKAGYEQQLRERKLGAVKGHATLIVLRAINPYDSSYQQKAKSIQLQQKANASLFLPLPLICPG